MSAVRMFTVFDQPARSRSSGMHEQTKHPANYPGDALDLHPKAAREPRTVPELLVRHVVA
jgi:hypothetical protein